jgi:hypothetical protein
MKLHPSISKNSGLKMVLWLQDVIEGLQIIFIVTSIDINDLSGQTPGTTGTYPPTFVSSHYYFTHDYTRHWGGPGNNQSVFHVHRQR